MNQTKTQSVRIVTGILLAVVLALTCISSVVSVKEGNVLPRHIATFVLQCSLICGGIYLMCGSRKQESLLYRLFMLYDALYWAGMTVAGMVGERTDLVTALVTVGILLLTVLLAVGKDLGKGKTAVIALALIALHIVPIVTYAVTNGIGTSLSTWVTEGTRLLVAITAGCLAYGKYADKAARGAK